MQSSRTHFQVLRLDLKAQVLGLEVCKSSKMSCPRLEDSIIFDWLKRRKQIKYNAFDGMSIGCFSFPYLKNNSIWQPNKPSHTKTYVKTLIGE